MHSVENLHLVAIPDWMVAQDIPRILTSILQCPSNKNLCFDISQTRGVSPCMMTFVAANALANPGTCLRIDPKAECFRYLQRMDFFNTCNIPTTEEFVRHPPAGRFAPLEKVTALSSCEQTARRLAAAVVGGPGPDSARPFFEYCISELLNNLRQHAESDGFVCAQYYRRSGEVRVSICDAGIGVRESLKCNPQYCGLTRDDEALRLAVRPNVTGKPPSSLPYSSTQNSGNGLYFLSRLAAKCVGQLHLFSATSLLTQRPDGAQATITTPYLQGTMVEMVIPRARIPDYDRIMGEIRAERFGAGPPLVRFE